ncbi:MULTISPECIES: hypothetical protein [Shewanella]|uniref:hypothetical protein n=1 Tax=Shewanella TaxID=22 RepID=UPI000491364F|nr:MULTISPECIES: hypothetical protein [Shewanella]QLE86750.1 hypothetical protein FLM48_17750 [Shewanella sp. Scap07]
MKIKNMFKVMLLGLGLGAAASAYAASCTQCNNAFNNCLESGAYPSACHTDFRACKRTVQGPCWLY